MSDKAAIYEYAGDDAGRPDFDFDTLRAAGMHKLAGKFVAAQHCPNRSYGDYSVMVTGNNDRMAQIAVYYDTATQKMQLAWRRCSWNGNWDAVWKYAATTEPPQEYDLPLAAGYTQHGVCFYLKTQENIVHFAGGVNVPDTYADGATIATLPAGYRPKKSINFPATGQSGINRAAMAIGVQVDGTIKCYGTLTGGVTNRVFFSGFFVAA